MKLDGKRVLITGAAGFVGGRLAERLTLAGKEIKVRGLVHNRSNLARLRRLAVEIVFGDVTSLASMRKRIHGCDVVVHCAVGSPYDTVHGTETTIKAALEHGVKKFIHMSSAAIYGASPSAEAVTDEKPNYSYTGQPYRDSKIDSEKTAFHYYVHGNLPLVVLRPVHIFGPYSEYWTIRPINMLRRGYCVLADGGNSPANVIYIDNVIDAIESAIREDNAVGDAFSIADSKLTTWKEFFKAYANMFRTPPPLLNLSSAEIAKVNRRKRTLAWITRTLQAVKLSSNLPRAVKWRARAAQTILMADKIPSDDLARVFTSKVQIPAKKATKVLDYRPRVSFEEGMRLTEKWLNASDRSGLCLPLKEATLIEFPSLSEIHNVFTSFSLVIQEGI